MPTYQRRGPTFKHQAQGTAWAVSAPIPRGGVIRLTLLSAGVMIGAAWAVFAMGGA